jgi:hypothetical protein
LKSWIPALLVSCTSPGTKDLNPPREDTGSAVETGQLDTAGHSQDTGTDSGLSPQVPLQFLLANIGNLDEATDGPCPAAPYHGSTCSMTQEDELGAQIAETRPDIVVLLEVFDSDTCTDSEGDPDWICAIPRDPHQQIRRLLGDDWTLSCDARSHRSCVGVRADAFEISGCTAGSLCLDGSTTAPHPEACGERGSLTSVSRVDLTATLASPLPEGTTLAVIATHALNATDLEGDACREAHYRDALDTVPGPNPALIAGDMNMDPYRLPDAFPSAAYWHTRVGEGRRFQALSVDTDPPTPTWMDIATLDYVLSDVLRGDCEVLNSTQRLDPVGQTLDHRGVLCSLTLAE